MGQSRSVPASRRRPAQESCTPSSVSASSWQRCRGGPKRAARPAPGPSRLLAGLDDLVDEAIRLRFDRPHEEVAVAVLRDLGSTAVAVMPEDLAQGLLQAQDLVGLDRDVDGRTADTAPWLVDHDARM